MPIEKGFSLASRLANAPVSFVTYLGKTFWPHDLTVFYPFADQLPVWQVWGCVLLIIVISAAVILMIKQSAVSLCRMAVVRNNPFAGN